MASIPDSPTALIIKSEARKQPKSIREVERKINGGAAINTQDGKIVLCLMVAEALMIIAIVPGPAVPGMASGMNAKLVRPVSLSREGDGWRGCGNSILEPIIMRIPPPAIRKPGMDILKTPITNSPI
ncbi:hypothetical protein D9M71_243620 [compost metagenome]